MRTKIAKHDSECSGCWDRIERGEAIVLVDGEWLCWECGQAEMEARGVGSAELHI